VLNLVIQYKSNEANHKGKWMYKIFRKNTNKNGNIWLEEPILCTHEFFNEDYLHLLAVKTLYLYYGKIKKMDFSSFYLVFVT
jgi:hypothetical protein